jgi:guanylate kinase
MAVTMHTVFLIIGKSGSGKDTVVKKLCERYDYTQLISYTTRPKRYEDEDTHVFISDAEYEAHRASGDIVAYTFYNGYHYFATKGQLYECDLYVIDPAGVEHLIKEMPNEHFVGIYLDMSEGIQEYRMCARGDSISKMIQRVEHDREAFANIDPSWYKIDASEDKEIILGKIKNIMQKHLTDSKLYDILSVHQQINKFGNANSG